MVACWLPVVACAVSSVTDDSIWVTSSTISLTPRLSTVIVGGSTCLAVDRVELQTLMTLGLSDVIHDLIEQRVVVIISKRSLQICFMTFDSSGRCRCA